MGVRSTPYGREAWVPFPLTKPKSLAGAMRKDTYPDSRSTFTTWFTPESLTYRQWYAAW